MLKDPGIYVLKVRDSHNYLDRIYEFKGQFEREWGTLWSVQILYTYWGETDNIIFHDRPPQGADGSEISYLEPADPYITISKLFSGHTI